MDVSPFDPEELDPFDRKIIQILRADGRLSVTELAKRVGLSKTPCQVRLKRLIDACAGHVDGLTSDDTTIGLCWDADRLNLWRIGVTPQPRFLSTPVAKRPEIIARSQAMRGQHLSWARIAGRIEKS